MTNRGFGVQVVPIRRSYVDAGVDRMGVILMTAVGFVLLIMCANLANLMLVRGASRQRELAVRAAMGAGRARLLWVSLSESVLLAVPGTADRVDRLAVGDRLDDRVIPGRTAVLVYLRSRLARRPVHRRRSRSFTTLAVGLLPSIRAARPDLVNDLKEAGRGLSLGRGGHRLQATLAISQVALCFGLLVGANLMVQSFLAMQRAGSWLRSSADPVGARLSCRRCIRRHQGAGRVLSDTSLPRCHRCRARVGGGDHQHPRRRWRVKSAAGDRRPDAGVR